MMAQPFPSNASVCTRKTTPALLRPKTGLAVAVVLSCQDIFHPLNAVIKFNQLSTHAKMEIVEPIHTVVVGAYQSFSNQMNRNLLVWLV